MGRLFLEISVDVNLSQKLIGDIVTTSKLTLCHLTAPIQVSYNE